MSGPDRQPREDAGKRLVFCDSANLQVTRPLRPCSGKNQPMHGEWGEVSANSLIYNNKNNTNNSNNNRNNTNSNNFNNNNIFITVIIFIIVTIIIIYIVMSAL